MNCNTQNAKIKSITEKTLIVGIDVGSETHYARAFDWRNIEFSKKPFAFSNDEAGFASFKAWLEDIKEKFGKTIVLPGMEPTGHYWFNLGAFLQDNGMKPVHVNPHHVHKSKELDDNNPSKDPKTIAALVNEGRFNYSYIPTGVYAEIRSLYGLQVMTQEALIRVKNRIGANFSQHHVEKLNVSYDALSVTPEGSHIGVNANLSAMFEAIENGLRLSLIESQQISLMSVREYGESESPSRDLPGGMP